MKAWLARPKERSRGSAAPPRVTQPGPNVAAGFAAGGIDGLFEQLNRPRQPRCADVQTAGASFWCSRGPPRAGDRVTAFERHVCVFRRRDEEAPALGRGNRCCYLLRAVVHPGEHMRSPSRFPSPRTGRWVSVCLEARPALRVATGCVTRVKSVCTASAHLAVVLFEGGWVSRHVRDRFAQGCRATGAHLRAKQTRGAASATQQVRPFAQAHKPYCARLGRT